MNGKSVGIYHHYGITKIKERKDKKQHGKSHKETALKSAFYLFFGKIYNASAKKSPANKGWNNADKGKNNAKDIFCWQLAEI